jgi:thiamine pyrophosphokinase
VTGLRGGRSSPRPADLIRVMPAEGSQGTWLVALRPTRWRAFTLRAVIFANGELRDRESALAAIEADDRVIAADGGMRHLRDLGLTPGWIIGDLDSLVSIDLEPLEASGVEILRHPRHKDQTDLELAMLHAVDLGADEIVVFGGFGKRWDHTLANLLLSLHPQMVDVSCVFVDGGQRIFTARGPTRIEGTPGDVVSLIPVGGDAEGVTTSGLEYPLKDGRLTLGSTLGVSNVLIQTPATLDVRQGQLLVIVSSESADGGEK